MSQVEIAKAIAMLAHRGQVDKGGAPYIDHPSRVAYSLRGGDEMHIAAGWLHDVLEDSDITASDLTDCGVHPLVLGIVEALTRQPEVTASDYYKNIMQTWGARVVKLADVADNLDPKRLSLLDDATIARLTRKYAKARQLLGATS